MASLVGPLCSLFVLLLAWSSLGDAGQSPLLQASNDTITRELFFELEELARIVDIAYCVGTAGLGIQKPFDCASHCGDEDFKTFELVTVCARDPMSCAKLTGVDVEYRPAPIRLLRLYRSIPPACLSAHYSRFPRHLLHR